ncbi:hypothetical protein KC727_01575 [Candidatus Kaiserbacteria bacterium]|nr:hypothetical protein [Candidatus Kaiserbacteria bacterium]
MFRIKGRVPAVVALVFLLGGGTIAHGVLGGGAFLRLCADTGETPAVFGLTWYEGGFQDGARHAIAASHGKTSCSFPTPLKSREVGMRREVLVTQTNWDVFSGEIYILVGPRDDPDGTHSSGMWVPKNLERGEWKFALNMDQGRITPSPT